MKQFILKSAIVLACLITTVSCKGQKIFQDLATRSDVESVYVGKAMMGLAKGAFTLSADGDSKVAMNAIKGINSIEIINCEEASAIPSVKKQAHQILAKLNLDVLMETRDGDELVTIYGKSPADDSKDTYISSMIIESSEPGEYSLIHINGKIDPATLLAE